MCIGVGLRVWAETFFSKLVSSMKNQISSGGQKYSICRFPLFNPMRPQTAVCASTSAPVVPSGARVPRSASLCQLTRRFFSKLVWLIKHNKVWWVEMAKVTVSLQPPSCVLKPTQVPITRTLGLPRAVLAPWLPSVRDVRTSRFKVALHRRYVNVTIVLQNVRGHLVRATAKTRRSWAIKFYRVLASILTCVLLPRSTHVDAMHSVHGLTKLQTWLVSTKKYVFFVLKPCTLCMASSWTDVSKSTNFSMWAKTL